MTALQAHSAHSSTITVRNLDDAVKPRLRLRAAQNGRSIEDEARAILRDALLGPGASEARLVHYAELVAARERDRRPGSVADGQIAAICRHHGATLATHNVRDFDATGLDLCDPWAAPAR